MKKLIVFFTVFALSGIIANAQVPQLGKASVDEVVKAMTIEEKARLLVGTGMAGFGGGSSNAVVGETQSLVPGAAGTTYPIPRLGIPAIVVADGPAGLRIAPKRDGSADTYYCTAFPVGTLLASTWDVGLVEKVGKAMGNEVLEYGVDVLLAPALNIHRNPLCGRNFEYYSEDPLLTGKITAAMVKGVQSNGVGTSIKHFAVNSQETNRMGNDARLSTRALREIYLKGFEIAVKESNPWTVMSSYNYINGTYASENRGLLTSVLRDEWGYKGFVMTDWFGGKKPPAQVHAGNDLLMPGHDGQYSAIVNAAKDGSLKMEDLDTNVKRILEIILISPRFKGYKFSNKPDLKAHAVVTRQSASEGMILLKNEKNTLPLPQTVKNIAAFGTTSYDFIAGGTGSGDVNEAYTVSLVEGMQNAGYKLDSEIEKIYKDYETAEIAKQPKSDNPMMAFMNQARIPEFIPEKGLIAKKAKESDVACITIGRNSGEFSDRTLDGDFLLTTEEKELIKQVTDAFHKEKKKVVVILNVGGVIETASWKNIPDAILLAWQGGQEGGNSVADILKGVINPSGKLTMTFPVNYMDHASSSNFPYDYKADSNPMAAMMAPEKEEKDKVKNVDYTMYEEGIYVGYRYFDTFKKDVSFPFGFGLSYTTFEYSNTKASKSGSGYTITVNVKNTGKVSGKEVVQLYVTAPANTTIGKPQKELKAFAKTKELKPGESETISLVITDNNLASFDQNKSAWTTDAGKYKLHIGASSRDLKQSLDIDVSGKDVKVNEVMGLQKPLSALNP
jgi:Beta-glucosidase-related glycosidases